MSQNRDWEVNTAPEGKQGKTVQDFIYFEGMYNPVLRFAFTNILDVPFVSYWDGQKYTIQPHDTVKLQHHLAVKFTKEIVDKMMQAEGRGLAMAVPASRKPYEDKVLTILPEENSTELEILKNQFVEQVKQDASREIGVAVEKQEMPKLDFNDLREQNFSTPAAQEPEKPKRGRPKKTA